MSGLTKEGVLNNFRVTGLSIGYCLDMGGYVGDIDSEYGPTRSNVQNGSARPLLKSKLINLVEQAAENGYSLENMLKDVASDIENQQMTAVIEESQAGVIATVGLLYTYQNNHPEYAKLFESVDTITTLIGE